MSLQFNFVIYCYWLLVGPPFLYFLSKIYIYIPLKKLLLPEKSILTIFVFFLFCIVNYELFFFVQLILLIVRVATDPKSWYIAWLVYQEVLQYVYII